MTTVILAEKPSQARSYMDGLGIKHTAKQYKASGSTFLDDDTVVVSAAGHLLELCEPEHYGNEYKDRDNLNALPIIPPRFDYMLRGDAKKLYFEIKDAVESANRVIVGTDMDNEGGAIAYNILRFSGNLKNKKILRAYPHALDKKAVIRQFKNLKPIDTTWRDANAAIARARSDWMIGMNLSRLYTSKLKSIGIIGNFAIGRAISTTLNLICQWEQSIEDFEEEPIFELLGETTIGNQKVALKSTIREVGEQNKSKFIKELKKHNLAKKREVGTVALIDSKIKETYPGIMFTKGDLYKEMSRIAGWSRAKSKKVMQANYDQGYQTYPRTDAGEIPRYQYDYLNKNFDDYMDVLGLKGKFDKFIMPEDKLKKYLVKENSDDAHYGIVPTEKIMKSDAQVSDDQRLMYEVVVRKSMTLLLPPYQYVSNKLGIKINGIAMIAQNNAMLLQGWKEILLPAKHKSKNKKSETKQGIDYAKFISKGDKVDIALSINTSKTKPPKHLRSIQIYDKGGLMERAYKYVENAKYASILKKVKGIGTSATRDQAMASLEAKKYITIDSKDVITVTANGWLINWLLKDSKVNDPLLTAEWEEEYNKIDKGTATSKNLINQTAQLVYDEIKRVNSYWDATKIADYYNNKKAEFDKSISLGKCPKCDSDVIFVKNPKEPGKKDFYTCTNRNCDFFIFKHIFKGKSITENDVKNLLKGKPTHEFKNLKKKNGETFSAKLIMYKNDSTDKYNLKFYFDKNKKAH